MSHTSPMTLCQRSRSHLEVKGQKCVMCALSGPQLHKLRLYLHETLWKCSPCCVGVSRKNVIVVFLYNFVKMFIMMSRRVTYKTHDSMSKVKVTLGGQGQIYVIYDLSGP